MELVLHLPHLYKRIQLPTAQDNNGVLDRVAIKFRFVGLAMCSWCNSKFPVLHFPFKTPQANTNALLSIKCPRSRQPNEVRQKIGAPI